MQYPRVPATLPAEPTGQPTTFPNVVQGPVGPIGSVGRTKKRRHAASTLILIAAILLVVAIVQPWWSITANGSGGTFTIGFLPGSSYSEAGEDGPVTIPSSGHYTPQLAGLYEAVLVAGAVAGVAAILAMLLGFLGTLRPFRSRAYFGLTVVAATVALGGAAGLPALVALYQPHAVTADSSNVSGSSGCGSGSSPCSSFWGTSSGGGSNLAWGADVGWYLAVVAAVVLAVGIGLLWSTRRDPYTREEVEVAYLEVPGA